MNGLNCELALAQLHSPMYVTCFSRIMILLMNPTKSISAHVQDVFDIENSEPMLDLSPKVTLTESNRIVWAAPGSVETFTSAFTSSGVFEDPFFDI